MDEIAKNYADTQTDSQKRSSAAARSRKSYNNNRIKVYRRRILNGIAKGHCVLEKTLNDQKYQWSDAERAMLRRCIDIRRERYVIAPENINFIRDKRYMRAARDLAVMETLREKINKIINNSSDNSLKTNLQQEIIPFLNKNIHKTNIVQDKRKQIVNQPQPFGNDTSSSNNSSPIQQRNNSIVRVESRENQNTTNKNTVSSKSSDSSKSSKSLPKNNDNNSNSIVDKVVISSDDVIQTYNYLIDVDIFYPNRSKYYKEEGKKEYKKMILRMFDRLKIHNPNFNGNLLHVYRNPYLYTGLTKNYPDALRIIFKMHLLSKQNKLPISKVPKSVVDLAITVKSTATFTEQHNLVQREAEKREKHRRENAPYYDWNEIKQLINLIQGESVTAYKDRVIMSIYIHENVLRDNLGFVYFFEKDSQLQRNDLRQIDYMYMGRKSRYKLILNTYKNEAFRGDFTIRISEKTSKLISVYINKLKETYPDREITYLITKNDGEPYSKGKLSEYIIRMFRKYTMNKVINLGINELRHSVATYYRNESDEFKSKLAYKMQHTLKTHINYERISNKVIKLFRNNDSEPKNPFAGKSIKVLINKKLVEGIVEETNDPDKYDIVFLDESIETKSMSSSAVALQLENQTVALNIGRKVKMIVDEEVYGSKEVTGVIDLNLHYQWSENSVTPPYIFVFDQEQYNTLEQRIEFDLPHPKISMI